MTPRMTAVVPARNAEDVIGACLNGLLSAGLSAGDIVVVDDASTDGTGQIARDHGVRLLRLSRRAGAAAARNAGTAVSDGAILLFVDADVVVHADTVAVVRDAFAREAEVAAIFGTYDARPADPGRVSRIRNLLHRHVHIRGAGEATTFWTGLGAVRRDAFEAVGGFDSAQCMMEDVAFGMALSRTGRRIRLVPALQGMHLKRWTLAGMARTDLLDRAIPWARLLRQHPAGGRVLNVGPAGYASVLSVAASLMGMLGFFVAPFAGAALVAGALVALAAANAPFLRRLAEEGRAGDRLAALPVLWVHYLCGGLGFAWIRLAG